MGSTALGSLGASSQPVCALPNAASAAGRSESPNSLNTSHGASPGFACSTIARARAESTAAAWACGAMRTGGFPTESGVPHKESVVRRKPGRTVRAAWMNQRNRPCVSRSPSMAIRASGAAPASLPSASSTVA